MVGVKIGITTDAPALLLIQMPKKIKIEIDFNIGDRVFLVADEEDQVPGMVTQIILSPTEATYMVVRGMEEKICYASELRDATSI